MIRRLGLEIEANPLVRLNVQRQPVALERRPRRQGEDQMRRAEELAAVSAKLKRANQELEAFSYSVSHDLRAPFRHIVGYSELLRDERESKLSATAERYIATIIESARFAGTLVDNLLSLSQIGRASLTVARDLAPRGYHIVIYDGDERAGGMIRSQSPKCRLPEEVIDEEVGDIADMGPEMRLGQRVESLGRVSGSLVVVYTGGDAGAGQQKSFFVHFTAKCRWVKRFPDSTGQGKMGV